MICLILSFRHVWPCSLALPILFGVASVHVLAPMQTLVQRETTEKRIELYTLLLLGYSAFSYLNFDLFSSSFLHSLLSLMKVLFTRNSWLVFFLLKYCLWVWFCRLKACPHERAKFAKQQALFASWRAREIISKSCSRLSELCFPTGWSRAETPASCAQCSANFIPSCGRCSELCSWTLIAARRALLARVDGPLGCLLKDGLKWQPFCTSCTILTKFCLC